MNGVAESLALTQQLARGSYEQVKLARRMRAVEGASAETIRRKGLAGRQVVGESVSDGVERGGSGGGFRRPPIRVGGGKKNGNNRVGPPLKVGPS